MIEKINTVAYKLQLPEGSQVHPVFHISLLKKVVKEGIISQPLPIDLNEEWELHVEPETIIDSKQKENGTVEALVRWKNLPTFEDSWEDLAK